jgi:tripartite-type tricarboxylate transporter receptor subunit TctC
VLDGFPPGGGTDYLARVLARKLTDSLGQPVIVDNRPGATGNVAAEIVAHATPDGYTSLMGLTSILAPSYTLYPRMGYNLLKDFAYVSVVASGTFVLSTHPSVPAKSVSELVSVAKATPGALRYGSSGVAGPLHLSMELLKRRTGIDMLHVPYKGAAPVVAALASGEVQVGFSSVAAAMPLVKAKRLNAIAVTTAKRAAALPDVPTIAESGFPGFDVTPWYGILVPAKTPRQVITLLNNEIAKVLQMPDVQASLATQAFETTSSTPERLRTIMVDEVNLWAKVIKDGGVKPE